MSTECGATPSHISSLSHALSVDMMIVVTYKAGAQDGHISAPRNTSVMILLFFFQIV